MDKQNKNNEIVIKNYQEELAFSNFLPGIVGLKGIPMWIFYINRGQAISSFGIDNKDSAISEFLPANRAYQQTPLQGFRTFLKIKENSENKVLEPFSDSTDVIEETMKIGMNSLELKWEHPTEKLQITIKYYSLPDAPIGALIRDVKIENMNDKSVDLELIDGLAEILPAGVNNNEYKEISNTLKSWFDVKKVEPDFQFYHLRGSTKDSENVKKIYDGNFYTSLVKAKGETSPAKMIYDKKLVFGNDESLRSPKYFEKNTLSKIAKEKQNSTNRVSSGFTLWEGKLAANDSVELMTLIGYGKNEKVIANYLENHFDEETVKKAFVKSKELTNDLTDVIQTNTKNQTFNQYARQTYLDNGLRGGFPTVHNYKDKQSIFYVYSRKHGDLERDYNFFTTSPTYYSQGNGNYRDINQNRRMDIFFTPEIKDYNIHSFIELIQLDGYNPLVVEKIHYRYENMNDSLTTFLKDSNDLNELNNFFKDEFEPGELLTFVQEENISLTTPFEEFLAYILCNSSQTLEAEHGEGFWIDHWTYNLDLIENYLKVYPDKINELMFNRKYRFYKNQATVQERAIKYIDNKQGFRQYGAVNLIDEMDSSSQWVHSLEEEPMSTNLYSKLILLASIKTATIAPYGYGISMEAGKPGWNDSLNGLPGLFGSSTSELFDLKRLVKLLEGISIKNIELPVEADSFLDKLLNHLTSLEKDDQTFWDKTTTLLEDYRNKIYHHFSGKITTIDVKKVRKLLDVLAKRIEKAIIAVNKSTDNELIPTYYYFERIKDEFKPYPVSPFLEGMVKKMRLTDEKEDAKNIYEAVKSSDIYDEKLEMYKTSVPLTSEPFELGRVRFFTRGWLENESVFLHMAYKYLLEILKNDLYDEFYQDIDTMLVANLDPEVYGRSILEHSSFIASSANPDTDIHGKGFVARLSGSTVEFLNMWVLMFIGDTPFKWENEELTFKLSPKLNKDFFKEDGSLEFKLFGETDVHYQNSRKMNTYGENAVKPVSYHMYYKDDSEKIIESHYLENQEAKDLRNKRVKKMDVILD